MTKIGFVGAGQMAQALGGGIAANSEGVEFVVSDPLCEAVAAFRNRVSPATVTETEFNPEVFSICDVVFLAIKPQYFEEAIDTEGVSKTVAERKAPPLVVSIMAGVEISKIQRQTSIESVIRVMPNTPCLVGAGACGLSASGQVTEKQIDQITGFLAATGIVVRVAENLLDAVTGLSGSGPAYVFELVHALALGGVRCGLPRDVAQQLASQTVFGAAKLAIETGEHPTVLRDRVTSPGGTTIAGLKALFDHGFQQSAMAAVEAATQRAREL